jgi:hypothetical protein
MKRLVLLMSGILALSGCVVVPYGYGYHRLYAGPRVLVPAPVVVVR